MCETAKNYYENLQTIKEDIFIAATGQTVYEIKRDLLKEIVPFINKLQDELEERNTQERMIK